MFADFSYSDNSNNFYLRRRNGGHVIEKAAIMVNPL